MAQFFKSLKHLSLFDLMMQVATLLWGVVLRRGKLKGGDY